MKHFPGIILALILVSLFALNSFAQSVEDYPETVIIDDEVYTREIIDGEVYYKCGDNYYVYDLEMGEMMMGEISFP